MRREEYTIALPSPIADGSGAEKPIRNLIDKFVEVTAGNYNYTLTVEYKIHADGAWNALLSTSGGTAVPPTAFPQAASVMRATVSSFVAETDAPAVLLSGRNSQTAP